MKRKFSLVICASVLLASACARQIESGGGQGTLMLSLSNANQFELVTKSVNESIYGNTNYYDVVITSGNGKEVLKCTGAALASNMPKSLDMGTYKIVASFGTEYPASRNDFYVEGSATIVLQPKEERNVEINCAPTCGKVYAKFDSEMDTYFSSYSVEYGGTEALGTQTVTFAKGENDPWYIKLLPDGETVTYKISLTTKDEYQQKNNAGEITKTAYVTGEFNLQRNKAHKLSIKPNYTPQDDGGMGLSIIIDESTEERNVNIEVPVAWI